MLHQNESKLLMKASILLLQQNIISDIDRIVSRKLLEFN